AQADVSAAAIRIRAFTRDFMDDKLALRARRFKRSRGGDGPAAECDAETGDLSSASGPTTVYGARRWLTDRG
ncbi:MAG: hypothetical protein ACODAB_09960, partial [Gemmatimonadota bacterium]